MVTVLQNPQPNPQRYEKPWKMYTITQIKICAEYKDMLRRPRLDLSGTHICICIFYPIFNYKPKII